MSVEVYYVMGWQWLPSISDDPQVRGVVTNLPQLYLLKEDNQGILWSQDNPSTAPICYLPQECNKTSAGMDISSISVKHHPFDQPATLANNDRARLSSVKISNCRDGPPNESDVKD
ncbi:hypothetical protein PENSUB_12781 [Penicillium subrubescens]|uniref:Uncharacterized protein n=1 Tax=Penicillium subrubescens TaxID=1316194 RepID=A0A1Q5SY21_9EURO|nr:hypothetical protein PENSUB_12781 [Penicillium subrubescens]